MPQPVFHVVPEDVEEQAADGQRDESPVEEQGHPGGRCRDAGEAGAGREGKTGRQRIHPPDPDRREQVDGDRQAQESPRDEREGARRIAGIRERDHHRKPGGPDVARDFLVGAIPAVELPPHLDRHRRPEGFVKSGVLSMEAELAGQFPEDIPRREQPAAPPARENRDIGVLEIDHCKIAGASRTGQGAGFLPGAGHPGGNGLFPLGGSSFPREAHLPRRGTAPRSAPGFPRDRTRRPRRRSTGRSDSHGSPPAASNRSCRMGIASCSIIGKPRENLIGGTEAGDDGNREDRARLDGLRVFPQRDRLGTDMNGCRDTGHGRAEFPRVPPSVVHGILDRGHRRDAAVRPFPSRRAAVSARRVGEGRLPRAPGCGRCAPPLDPMGPHGVRRAPPDAPAPSGRSNGGGGIEAPLHREGLRHRPAPSLPRLLAPPRLPSGTIAEFDDDDRGHRYIFLPGHVPGGAEDGACFRGGSTRNTRGSCRASCRCRGSVEVGKPRAGICPSDGRLLERSQEGGNEPPGRYLRKHRRRSRPGRPASHSGGPG